MARDASGVPERKKGLLDEVEELRARRKKKKEKKRDDLDLDRVW